MIYPGSTYDSRVFALVRAILWLKKTAVGLSFLFALVSSFALLFVHVDYPNRIFIDRLVANLLRPADDAGFYLGTIVFPNYTTPGTTGFYLAPLFGMASAFLVWWALWFFCIKLFRRIRPSKPEDIVATTELKTTVD
jgi:hypothetical protein